MTFDRLTEAEALAYLARIGIAVDTLPAPTPENLRLLQSQHQQTVPYENIDILRGVRFTLETAAVFDKVVRRRRGGYCFELCGLFATLLRTLGYEVTEHFARFLRGYPTDTPNTIPMRRHRVLRVWIPDAPDGDAYLCDVGVGGVCPMYPLRMVEGLVQKDVADTYRMMRHPRFGILIEELQSDGFIPYYAFTEDENFPPDFEAANYYCQMSPDVPFTRGPMCSIKTADGRRTLSGYEFRTFTASGVETVTVQDDIELYTILRNHFGIHIPFAPPDDAA